MCPSFMVTHEERHTTRGRAHHLHEMLNGNVIQNGWRDENVKRRSTSAWLVKVAGRLSGERRYGDLQGGVPLPLLARKGAAALRLCLRDDPPMGENRLHRSWIREPVYAVARAASDCQGGCGYTAPASDSRLRF